LFYFFVLNSVNYTPFPPQAQVCTLKYLHLFVQCDIILSGFVGKYKNIKIKMKNHLLSTFLVLSLSLFMGVFFIGINNSNANMTPYSPPGTDVPPTFRNLTVLEKLGIGTGTPEADFHIKNPHSSLSEISIENKYTLGSIFIIKGSSRLLFLVNNNIRAYLSLQTPTFLSSQSPSNRINLYSPNLLRFLTGTGDNIKEKLRITNDGKVGIGTETPQSNLHVGQDALFSGGISMENIHLKSNLARPSCNVDNFGTIFHELSSTSKILSCLCVEVNNNACISYEWVQLN
jgi:hypothetical protein